MGLNVAAHKILGGHESLESIILSLGNQNVNFSRLILNIVPTIPVR